MKDFRSLKVWENGHRLTLEIYKITSVFPGCEIYGLSSQMRRACASIPMNIAEGCGREGDAELARFLLISMGSSSELEYQLQLALDLEYITEEVYSRLNQELVEIRRMLNSFIHKLRATNSSSRPQPLRKANS